MKKIFLISLIIIFIIIGLIGILFYQYYFFKQEIKAPMIKNDNKAFSTKEECEKQGCICTFQMCDYIPEGQTPEICENKTGWVCDTTK